MSSERVAIVTAAGRGMGAAVARELAADGYALALLSSSGAAEKLAEELGGIGLTGSVTEPAVLERLVGATMDRHGRIDAVVNNTGHIPKGDLLDHDDAAWHASLDMALLNVVRMARLVTPVMRAQGGGAIVNVSTFSAFEPSLDYPLSSTLRAGLGSFTKLYADRYAADNIRMNSIPARLHRQPPARRRQVREGAPAPHRHDGGDREDRGVSPRRRRGLHHGPEPPGRRRPHARRVGAGADEHAFETLRVNGDPRSMPIVHCTAGTQR